MQNTEQKKAKHDIREIVIDEEFKNLIPPLSQSEFEGLKADIIKNGCKTPVVVWPRPEDGKLVLIDGHNRYKICTENNIHFEGRAERYESREAVKLAIINMQLNRRNITSFSRVELALLKENLIKESNNQGKRTDVTTEPEQNSKRHINSTNAKIGKIANVSEDTVRKIKKIREEAPEVIKDKLRNGDMNIEEGYKLTTLPEKLREKASDQIAQGTSVKEVIHEAAKQKKEEKTLEKQEPEEAPKPEPTKLSRYFQKAQKLSDDGDFFDFDPTNVDIVDPELDESTTYPDQYLASRDFSNRGNIWCDLVKSSSKVQEYASSICQQLEDTDVKENFQDIILVTPASTKEGWFQNLLMDMTSVCFAQGKQEAIFYYGTQKEKFNALFLEYGVCIPLLNIQLGGIDDGEENE